MENTINSSSTLNLFEKLNQWIQDSIMVKLFSIGFLVLILLIPSAWIDDLIQERQSRSDQVMQEVASKWSGIQTVSGPILVIPFTYYETVKKGEKDGELIEKNDQAFFLPEQLKIDGTVNPEKLNRSIFDAVVYSSQLNIQATFKKPDFRTLNISEANVHWEKSYMILGLPDFNGISTTPVIKIGNDQLASEPSTEIGVSIKKYTNKITSDNPEVENSASQFSSNGIVAKLNWQTAEDFKETATLKLNLKGSQRLAFVPTGKETLVSLQGPWSDPSFDGSFIPEDRKIDESGFHAKWAISNFNRPFIQQWVGKDEHLTGSEFWVRLLVPVDQYQKSMRTSKYSQFIIILTFIALFLVEVTRKIRIHPFQYILIGAALTIYYTLLLSISEHLNYDTAYWIATLATVTLVSFYATSFLKNASLVILLTVLLTVFYSFIYIIIVEQDYSLLIGSIGLFVMVAALMFFSRNVKWYKEEIANKSTQSSS